MKTTISLTNGWVIAIHTFSAGNSINSSSNVIRLTCYADKSIETFHRCYTTTSVILSYDAIEISNATDDIANVLLVIVLSNGDVLQSIITFSTTKNTTSNYIPFNSIEEVLGMGEHYKDASIIGEFRTIHSLNGKIDSSITKVNSTFVLITTNIKGILLSTEALIANNHALSIKEVYNNDATTKPTAALFLSGLQHLETVTDDLKLEMVARRRGLLQGWKSLIRTTEVYEPDNGINSNAYDCFLVGFEDGSLLYFACSNDATGDVKVYSWQIPLASSTTVSLPIDAILLANLNRESYSDIAESVISPNPLLATHLVIVSGSKVSLLGSRLVGDTITPDFKSFDISILEIVTPRYKIDAAVFFDMSMFFIFSGELYVFTITSRASADNKTGANVTRLTDQTTTTISNITISNKGMLTLLSNTNDNTNDFDILQLNLGSELGSKSYRHLFQYNANTNTKTSVDLTLNIRNTLSKINEYVSEEVKKRTLLSALDLEALRLVNLLKLLEQKQDVTLKSNSCMVDNWNMFTNINISLRNELGLTTTKGKRLYLDIDFIALDELTMKALHGRMIIITISHVDRPLLTQEGTPSFSLPLNFANDGNTYSSKFAIPITSTLSLAPISIDISLNISLINVEIDYFYTNNVINSDKNHNTSSIGIGSESAFKCACVFPMFYKVIPLDEMLMIISSDSFMQGKSLGAALVRDNKTSFQQCSGNRVQSTEDDTITMNIHVPKYNDASINADALANTLQTFEKSINSNNNTFDLATTIKPAFLKSISSNIDRNNNLQLHVKLGQAIAINGNDDNDSNNSDVYHIRCNDFSLASQVHATAIDTIMKALPTDNSTDDIVYSDGDVYSLPRDLQRTMSDLATINMSLTSNNTNNNNNLLFNIIDNIINSITDDDGGHNEIKMKTNQLLHIYSKLRTGL